jgi:acyl carrier protein
MATESPTLESFLEKFGRQFDEPPAVPLTSETPFRSLPGWTSLQSLIIMISIDENYGVTLGAEEFERAQTVGELYQLLREKQEG